jgi:hypothetical protein
MNEVDVVREVTDTIQAALKRNRRIETTLLGLLGGIGLTGIGFLVTALFTARWELAVSGGIVELAILMPIRELVKLRRENLRLEILPQLIRLADTANRKKLVFDLITRLIEQIPS